MRARVLRPHPRQRDFCVNYFYGIVRRAQVPLTQSIGIPPLGQINMDVVLVMVVRSGAEDGREARTRAAAQWQAELHWGRGIGKHLNGAAREFDRAHVECIGFSVLAELRPEQGYFGHGNRKNRRFRPT
jgi:hypothetical protein